MYNSLNNTLDNSIGGTQRQTPEWGNNDQLRFQLQPKSQISNKSIVISTLEAFQMLTCNTGIRHLKCQKAHVQVQ